MKGKTIGLHCPSCDQRGLCLTSDSRPSPDGRTVRRRRRCRLCGARHTTFEYVEAVERADADKAKAYDRLAQAVRALMEVATKSASEAA